MLTVLLTTCIPSKVYGYIFGHCQYLHQNPLTISWLREQEKINTLKTEH